jgi:hypothetical protein
MVQPAPISTLSWYDHISAGFQLLQLAQAAFKIKGIAANNRVSVNDHVVAYLAEIINDGVGVNDTIISDGNIVAHKYAGHDHCVFANAGSGADGCVRELQWLEMPHQFIVSCKRFLVQQQYFSIRALHLLVDDHGGSFAGERILEIFGMIYKDQVAFVHAMDLIKAGNVFL